MNAFNCFVIMNETDPVAAVEKARERLNKYIYPSRNADDAPLYMDPEVVPPGWGYPNRVVVTFHPDVRDWDDPAALSV